MPSKSNREQIVGDCLKIILPLLDSDNERRALIQSIKDEEHLRGVFRCFHGDERLCGDEKATLLLGDLAFRRPAVFEQLYETVKAPELTREEKQRLVERGVQQIFDGEKLS